MIPWKRNFIAKALALVGALVLWAFVMSEQNPMVEVEYKIPVRLVNTKASQIVEKAPKDINVVLRGPRNIILHLDQRDLIATINMRNVEVGKESVPIHFDSPDGLNAIKKNPSMAELEVDTYALKEVPIKVITDKNQPKGYGVKAIKNIPENVTVSGAKSRVERVVAAIIPLKLDGRKDDFEFQREVMLEDAKGKVVSGLEVQPKFVKTKVEVDKDYYEKTVEIVEGLRGEPAPGYEVASVTLSPNRTVISGTQDVMKTINKVTIEPIDISGATETIKKEVEILPINGIKIGDNKAVITINIVKKK